MTEICKEAVYAIDDDKCPDCNGTGQNLLGMIILHIPICLTCGGSGKKK